MSHRWQEMTDITADAMRVGDVVEFCSDRQTEKGPSSGTVVARQGDFVMISHSDTPAEIFRVSKLHVKALAETADHRRLWRLC